MKVHDLIKELLKIPNQEAEIKFAHVSPMALQSFKIDGVKRQWSDYFLIHKVNNEFLGITQEDEWALQGYDEDKWEDDIDKL